MKRVNFYFSEVQLEKIYAEAKTLGISNAEMLRRIIDRYFEDKEKRS